MEKKSKFIKKKYIELYINNSILKYIHIFKSIIIFFFIYNYIKILHYLFKLKYLKKKRVGVVGLNNHNNIGNNLIKFSMFVKLKELGYEPIIIGITNKNDNISFLRKYVKLKEINETFSELNRSEYDFLMVNSDQTWNNYSEKYFLDYGFLKFAKNWEIPKFVYGASLGHDYWNYSKEFDNIAKNLLKNFSGISVREISAINFVENHLNIKPFLVLDPTFLIDKKYYINIIKDYKPKVHMISKYLCIYQLDPNKIMEEFIEESSTKLNYTIYNILIEQNNSIEDFIYGINISEAVITDSYHGTIFSIIFNKPFISFINTLRGRGRFTSLIDMFNLKERIIYSLNKSENLSNILKKPLNINKSLLNSLKKFSINYLKKNLLF